MRLGIKNNLSKNLFWDVNKKNVDADIHCQFIVERLLSRGTLDEFKFIKSFYGVEKIKSIVVEIKNLDAKVLSFCSPYFTIPKIQFRCFNFKHLSQTHWKY